jgi:hypothetical protein
MYLKNYYQHNQNSWGGNTIHLNREPHKNVFFLSFPFFFFFASNFAFHLTIIVLFYKIDTK